MGPGIIPIQVALSSPRYPKTNRLRPQYAHRAAPSRRTQEEGTILLRLRTPGGLLHILLRNGGDSEEFKTTPATDGQATRRGT